MYFFSVMLKAVFYILFPFALVMTFFFIAQDPLFLTVLIVICIYMAFKTTKRTLKE